MTTKADHAEPAPPETGPAAASASTDGRRRRRERNRLAVLEAVQEMFEEEMLVPSIELAAERSGLSLRSVYRYFPDPETLIQAAIQRQVETSLHLSLIHEIGQGPFDQRLTVFVRTRLRMYDQLGKSYRAAVHHESTSPQIRDQLHATRRLYTSQFERQFAPELEPLAPALRLHRVIAGDLLSQLDAIDLLRRYRRLTVAETREQLTESLRELLQAPA